ncbi:MAG: thioesterase family protein [Chitinophagales bacterium]|nr:thioesterase family protein [Chitinophagales bacterium]
MQPILMYVAEKHIRVRYGETDQMGYVYYGNYPLYYEEGRTDAIKQLGIIYKQMEADGILMPVAELLIRYIGPAVYDEELKVRTTIKELPTRKMKFYTDIFNEQGLLINTGETTLVFVKAATRKACMAPEKVLAALRPFFE